VRLAADDQGMHPQGQTAYRQQGPVVLERLNHDRNERSRVERQNDEVR